MRQKREDHNVYHVLRRDVHGVPGTVFSVGQHDDPAEYRPLQGPHLKCKVPSGQARRKQVCRRKLCASSIDHRHVVRAVQETVAVSSAAVIDPSRCSLRIRLRRRSRLSLDK